MKLLIATHALDLPVIEIGILIEDYKLHIKNYKIGYSRENGMSALEMS